MTIQQFPKVLALVATLAAALIAVPVQAQDSPTTPTLPTASAGKFGFVDIELALANSAAIRQIMGEVDEELAADSAEIERKRAEARRIRQSLEQQGSILSDRERQARQQQALDLLAEVDEMEFRFSRKVRDHQRATIEPLLEQVIQVVGDVARRDGFDLVVRGEMVLYGRDTVDLTPALVRELDSRAAELRERTLGTQPTTGGTGAPLLPLVP